MEELRLTIWDNETLVGGMDREYVNEMADAAADLILCPLNMSFEDTKAMEEKILNIYKDTIDRYNFDDMMPFSAIYEECRSHNDEIFQTLAEIEYVHGPHHYYENHVKYYMEEEGCEEDEVPDDEVASIMIGEWEDYYYSTYMDMFKHLDEYVSYVLNKYRYSYSFEHYDIPFDNTNAGNIVIRNQGATFINNDSQNAIMPELMNFGFAGYSEFLNYHEELDVIKGLKLLTAAQKDKKHE